MWQGHKMSDLNHMWIISMMQGDKMQIPQIQNPYNNECPHNQMRISKCRHLER